MELFDRSLAINDFPSSPGIIGIGLSDWKGYGGRLGKSLGYTNTYYHTDPRLDITNIDPSQCGLYDFIISSEVFEHVLPPVSKAFENARRLLKPGGVLILTVPYVEGTTREHFPGVQKISIKESDGELALHGEFSDGQIQVFKDIKFHGGPGSTLEMRLFGKDSLLREFENAGFDSVCVHDEVVEEFGIYWNPYDAERAPYRPLLYGADTPPWAGRVSSETVLDGSAPAPSTDRRARGEA
jgi:SAM-dependent methyltransferase